MGTYLHGLLHSEGFRNEFIKYLSEGRFTDQVILKQQDDILDQLAQHLENIAIWIKSWN